MDNLLESNERTLVMFDAVCSGLSACLALVHADIKQMTEHRNKLAALEQEQIQAKLEPEHELDRSIEESKNQSKRKKRADLDASQTGEDDPHHLAKLKLLDKRLADSFSQALSLNDLQTSSIHAKLQHTSSKPSIFQVLLGKSGKNSEKNKSYKNNPGQEEAKLDNRTIIDDINRQTRLAMQYSKQLEAHLLKVEDLRTRYEMHLKMGLVVKSVANAYVIGNNSSNSPSSLARKHHCSSLVINDSSSMGTHSSLSSLNLSTWSSSRSNAKKRREAINNESRLNYYNHQNNNNNNQLFVSTISLNSQKRSSLAKLISSSASRCQQVECTNQIYEPTMISRSKRTVPSQSVESPNSNHYSYGEWKSPEPSQSAEKRLESCNATISKSSANLNSSQSSLKRNRSKSQQANRTTIKEFIENIDKIESEFESYMGSFLLAVEDIQGFARVCQGDVFEISIKYGDAQKFKTKISVLKDNRQKCDNRQAVFKAKIADVLAIKAYECKGLGKRVLLGHKLCETRDLFTARSQLMTISLNQTGSIKLNLIVTWNPLHLAPNSSSASPGLDISHISLPPTPVSSSTLSSLSSVPSLNGTTTTINIQSQRQPQQQLYHHHMARSNQVADAETMQRSPQHHETIYQAVDANHGYYIPPPDYVTSDSRY